MGKVAGVITINLNAGTSQFVRDMSVANASVKSFGATSKTAFTDIRGHSVSSMAAASGAIREFEGRLPIRAVENFLSKTLGLGPVLQKAFPIVGAVAFAGIIVEAADGVIKFFTSVANAPQKIKSAFGELNQSLTVTNDQLRVANDRLADDIAKLEHRHQNTLKLALDEARLAADNLAKSLSEDLKKVNELLEKNAINWFSAWANNQAGSGKDIEDMKLFAAGISNINYRGSQAVRAATTEAASKAARDQWSKELNDAIDREIGKYQTRLSRSELEERVHIGQYSKQDEAEFRRLHGLSYAGGVLAGPLSTSARDQADAIERQKGIISNLQELRDSVGLSTDDEDLKGRKAKLEGAKPEMDEQKRLLEKFMEATARFQEVFNKVDGEIAAINAGEEAALAKINKGDIKSEGLIRSTAAVERASILNKAYEEQAKELDKVFEAQD